MSNWANAAGWRRSVRELLALSGLGAHPHNQDSIIVRWRSRRAGASNPLADQSRGSAAIAALCGQTIDQWYSYFFAQARSQDRSSSLLESSVSAPRPIPILVAPRDHRF